MVVVGLSGYIILHQLLTLKPDDVMLAKRPAIIPASKGQWATAILSLLLLAATFHSLVFHHPDKPGCGTVWMYPSYAKLTGFNKKYTRLGDKYSLYLYRDDHYQKAQMDSFQPSGIPVIFIPGNAGSYKQARSIGSLAAEIISKRGLSEDQRLDFYTADFQEDFTAFHGRTLLDQAEFVNDAIRFILALYDQPDPDKPHPKSVIVIGHSMGGFIARTLVGLDNYVPESVNTILTLASPHAMPPLTFDSELTNVYSQVNKYWAQAYSSELIGRSPLSTVAMVSIAGGKPDNMVPSDYASISAFTRPSNGFTTFSYSMPAVWTAIDHQAIVWCHQCRAAIVNALLEITDSLSPSKTKSLQGRMQTFAKYFLSGFEPYQYNKFYDRAQKVEALPSRSKARNAYFPKDIKVQIPIHEAKFIGSTLVALEHPYPKFSLITIPDNPSPNDFLQIYANNTDEVDILLCSKASTIDLQSVYLDCYDTKQDIIKIPYSSMDYHDEPYMTGYRMGQETTSAAYIEYNITRDLDGRFSHAVVKSKLSPSNSNNYVVINTQVEKHKVSVDASFLKMIFGGVMVKLPHSQASDISLRGASSSLFSYVVKVSNYGAAPLPGFFAPLIRQYIIDPFESKFHVNVLGPYRKAYIFFHGLAAPYIPHIESTTRQDDNNLHLQIFTPPLDTHSGSGKSSYHVRIKMDWWGFLGNLVPRYRTVLIPFSIAVVALVGIIQLHVYTVSGRIVSFSDSSRKVVKAFLPIVVPGLAILQFLLSFKVIRSLTRLVQTPLLTVLNGFSNTAKFAPSSSSSVSLSNTHSDNGIRIENNNLLSGVSQTELIFLTPLLVFLALGLTLTLHGLIVGLINITVQQLSKYSPPSPRRDPKETLQLFPSPLFFGILGFSSILTAVYAPYTLVFTGAVLYFIYILGYAKYLSLAGQKPDATNPSKALTSFINFGETLLMLLLWTVPLGIPVIIAWIHTLIEFSFTEPCSSHRSPLAIFPSLLLVYTCRRIVLRSAVSSSIGSSTVAQKESFSHFIETNQHIMSALLLVSKGLLGYTAVYALLMGFYKTYVLFNLVNLICFFIVGVYIYYCYQEKNKS